MQLHEVPQDVLQAAETISRWAKETNHSACRIGSVVYATDYQDIRPLFMHHETVPVQEDEPYAYAYENIDLPEDVRAFYGPTLQLDKKERIPPNWKEICLYTHPKS